MFTLRILIMFCALPLAAAQSGSTAFERHLELAQKAQAQQDCHTAAIEYAAVVRLMPMSGELRTNEGIALYCDAQLPAAIVAFRKALTLNASLATPHLFLGLAAHRLGDDDSAEMELAHFLKVNPGDETAHLWLGYTYAAKHREELALEQFERVTQMDPRNVDAQYSLGQVELELARQQAKALEHLAPDGDLILKLAAEQYRETGDVPAADRANAELERRRRGGVTDSPEKMKPEEALSEAYHVAKDGARRAFQAVVDEAPESDRAHQILAESLISMKKPAAAIDEYRKVLELNPALPGIHEVISNCLMHDGRFADALAELHKEQGLEVDSARLLTEIGQVQLEMGDGTAATVSLRKAEGMRDVPSETFFLLGKALLRQNDARGAIAALQNYIARDSTFSTAYYLLARAYRLNGDREAMNKTLTTYRDVAQRAKSRSLVQPLLDSPDSVAEVRSLEDDSTEMQRAAQP